MLPLFDVMLKAQNGESMLAMARQFGLAQEQASKAIAALIPAFSTGFTRSSHDPYGLASLVSGMTSGSYAKYFEDIGRAFTPQRARRQCRARTSLRLEGDVAGDCATGRTLFRHRAGHSQADDARHGRYADGRVHQGNDRPDPLCQCRHGFRHERDDPAMDGDGRLATEGGRARRGEDRRCGLRQSVCRGHAFDLGARPAEPDAATARQSVSRQSRRQGFNEMLANTFAAFTPPKPTAQPEPKASAKTATEDGPASLHAYGDLVRQMFDGGIEVQKTYQRNVEAIFDSYLGKSAAAH